MRSSGCARAALAARALVVAIACWGCQPQEQHELLQLEALSARSLRAGSALGIQGSGFASGRDCRVRFRGRLHAPGEAPQPVDVTLAARAPTEERIEVAVDRADIDALGGRGTFAGELHVVFDARASSAQISGVLGDVRLDVVDEHRRSLRQHAARARRARAWLARVGVHPSEESGERGVIVERVRASGAAARAGLSRGDVIVRVAGVRVRSVGDLLPEPSARTVDLGIERAGKPTELSLSWKPELASSASFDNGTLVAMAALALLGLLWLSPASPLCWFLRRHRALQRASARAVGASGARCTPERRVGGIEQWLSLALGPLLASALLLAMASSRPLLGFRIDALSLCLAVSGARGALSVLGTSRARHERLRVAGAALERWLVSGVAVACACAAGGTRVLDGLVAAQGGAPWRWAAFTNPALFVLLPLVIAAMGRQRTSLATGRTQPKGGLDDGFATLLCGIIAAVWLGGWQPPGGFESPRWQANLLGALGFMLKSWCVLWLVHRAGSLRLYEALPPLARLCWIALAALATSGWITWAPSSAQQGAIGWVLVAVAGACAILVPVHLRLRGSPADHVDPFS